MTDLATNAPLSTTLDGDTGATQAGAGKLAIAEPKEPVRETARESLEAVIKNEDRRSTDAAKKADPNKDDANPAEAAKSAEKGDEQAQKAARDKENEEDKGEFQPMSDSSDRVQKDAEQQRQHVEAPKHFSETAREKWRNTPREVQNEVARHAQEGEVHRVRSERYERIREFDELAQTNGRDLRDSLSKINHIENLMKANPLAGLNAILQEIGPRKSDGLPITLMEVAQYVTQAGQQGYNQAMQQGQQFTQAQEQEQRQNSEKQAQQAQFAALVTKMVIEPFAQANPRYHELQDSIAFFLNSPMIDQNLSPQERLKLAYDMAERAFPPSNVQPIASARAGLDQEPARRADPDDLSGSKSIKSAPGSVSDEGMEFEAKAGESVLDSVREAARRLKRA
ncbi:MAG: hypothetical protein J7498_05485 [Sphingobium sp.]|nr:hypothetical protein [Sphingobium sp.]